MKICSTTKRWHLRDGIKSYYIQIYYFSCGFIEFTFLQNGFFHNISYIIYDSVKYDKSTNFEFRWHVEENGHWDDFFSVFFLFSVWLVSRRLDSFPIFPVSVVACRGISLSIKKLTEIRYNSWFLQILITIVSNQSYSDRVRKLIKKPCKL